MVTDALSCAGPILASGRLPSKHIANVVVSLARQKHLSPALVATARDLLQTNLNLCNGQDVSQILFGLMLDKQSVPDAAETFRVIAPALAQHLRSDESFQVRPGRRASVLMAPWTRCDCCCRDDSLYVAATNAREHRRWLSVGHLACVV